MRLKIAVLAPMPSASDDDDDRCEAWPAAKLSQTVANILERGLERGDAAGIAAFLLDLLDAADREPGLPLGLVSRHAGADELFDLSFTVELQLRGQLALHRSCAERSLAAGT